VQRLSPVRLTRFRPFRTPLSFVNVANSFAFNPDPLVSLLLDCHLQTSAGHDLATARRVPGLYFGRTKMNNVFDVVDEVVKENGGPATFFVKAGDEYERIVKQEKMTSVRGRWGAFWTPMAQ
jgi:hypothetical protein